MRKWLWNSLYLTALTAALPWLAYRRATTGRYKHGLREKLFGLDVRSSKLASLACDEHRETIWLHGVSVGEVQLLRPLMDALQIRRPLARFVISTTTQTGMELAERLFPTEVAKIYFPFDFSWAVDRTLATLKPALLVLGELELWPNLVRACNQRGVPIAVVNARLSEKSYRGYQRFRGFVRPMFAGVSLVASQSVTYSQRFANLGSPAKSIVTTGSFKFDNVSFDAGAREVQSLKKLVGIEAEDRVWVVGSTQSPEESAVCDAFLAAREQFPALKLIVIPRHAERFDSVAAELAQRGVRLLRRSTLKSNVASSEWDVLLVDTIGELRWWWGVAELALVGGSFGKRGGQNMIEPAAYGTNVAFGPNTSNFRDIVELLLNADAATRLSSLEEISPWLEGELANNMRGVLRGRNAQRLIRNNQGALTRTAELVSNLIQTDSPKFASRNNKAA